jgi:hypothetical protein
MRGCPATAGVHTPDVAVASVSGQIEGSTAPSTACTAPASSGVAAESESLSDHEPTD